MLNFNIIEINEQNVKVQLNYHKVNICVTTM